MTGFGIVAKAIVMAIPTLSLNVGR